jgi:hypothetical protein
MKRRLTNDCAQGLPVEVYKHLKSINIAVTSKELVTYSGQIKG